MSKPPHHADDPPPSYTDSLSFPSPSVHPPPTPPTNPSPSSSAALTTHLRSLPQRIRQAASQAHQRQTEADLAILSHALLPRVEAFLLSPDLPAAARAGGAARLVAVPLEAVPAPWAPSEGEERRKAGEVVRVERVVDLFAGEDGKGERGDRDGDWKDRKREEEHDGGGAGMGRGGTAREFDGWGRWDDDDGTSGGGGAKALLWWRDEAMARRLAAYLQPKEPVETERREIRAQVRKDKEKKRPLFGWGARKASDAKTAQVPARTMAPVGPAVAETDGVSMTVRAEEVTFRRENEFGIWESRSGFAIVVTIRMRKT